MYLIIGLSPYISMDIYPPFPMDTEEGNKFVELAKQDPSRDR